MSVWLVLPSKRPVEEMEKCLSLWRQQGYHVMIQRDPGENVPTAGIVSYARPYAGYADAVNFLAREAMLLDYSCDWVVSAGDDTEPDMNHTADEIAVQLTAHFGGTFGVCQPTGDRWGEGLYPNAHKYQETPGDPNRCAICHMRSGGPNHCVGANIDRVAGSPWMGREWCLRANQGKGPQWPYFFHSYADETLQCVAEKLGVFWQRRDLIHFHRHWARPYGRVFWYGPRIGQVTDMPEFAKRANTEEEEKRSKAEFERLRAGGFAECLPL